MKKIVSTDRECPVSEIFLHEKNSVKITKNCPNLSCMPTPTFENVLLRLIPIKKVQVESWKFTRLSFRPPQFQLTFLYQAQVKVDCCAKVVTFEISRSFAKRSRDVETWAPHWTFLGTPRNSKSLWEHGSTTYREFLHDIGNFVPCFGYCNQNPNFLYKQKSFYSTVY